MRWVSKHCFENMSDHNILLFYSQYIYKDGFHVIYSVYHSNLTCGTHHKGSEVPKCLAVPSFKHSKQSWCVRQKEELRCVREHHQGRLDSGLFPPRMCRMTLTTGSRFSAFNTDHCAECALCWAQQINKTASTAGLREVNPLHSTITVEPVNCDKQRNLSMSRCLFATSSCSCLESLITCSSGHVLLCDLSDV